MKDEKLTNWSTLAKKMLPDDGPHEDTIRFLDRCDEVIEAMSDASIQARIDELRRRHPEYGATDILMIAGAMNKAPRSNEGKT